MQRRKVDLPDPEGPSRHMTSPRRDLEIDALQHLEAPEALVDAFGLDHGLLMQPPGCRSRTSDSRIVDLLQRARTPVRKWRSMKYCPTYRMLVMTRYQMLATISSGIDLVG